METGNCFTANPRLKKGRIKFSEKKNCTLETLSSYTTIFCQKRTLIKYKNQRPPLESSTFRNLEKFMLFKGEAK